MQSVKQQILKKQRTEKNIYSFASISTINHNSAPTCYFMMCVSGYVSVSVSMCVKMNTHAKSHPCVCVIRAFCYRCSKPVSPSEANAHSGVEIACLDCSEPRNRIWKHYSWKTGHYPRKPTEKCLVEISKLYNSWTEPEPAGEVWTDTVVPQQPPTHQTVCCSSSLLQSDHYDYKSVIGKQPNLQMAWHEKVFKVIMVQCGLTKPHSFHFPHCGLGSVRVWPCQTSFLAGYTVDYLKDWLVLSCAEASAGFLLALDWKRASIPLAGMSLFPWFPNTLIVLETFTHKKKLIVNHNQSRKKEKRNWSSRHWIICLFPLMPGLWAAMTPESFKRWKASSLPQRL